MMTLIDEANGNGIFWGVLDSGSAVRAIQRLIPEAAKFARADDLFGKMKEVLVTLKGSSDLELEFQWTAGSSKDAMLLSQLLQAGVMYQQYQSGRVTISSNDNQLELSITLTDEQVLILTR